jgi:hypothetical protein
VVNGVGPGAPAAQASLIVVVDSVWPAVRALVSTNDIVTIDYISYLGVK